MKSVFMGMLLIGCIGCTSFTPIGPLAQKKAPPQSSILKELDTPDPITVSAPKPVPPAMLIVPEEVNSGNAVAAAQKLENEYEFDWKSLPPPSKTVEVSRIKGGVKEE
ncbi:MAG TPA: hypothetical protein VGL71_10530 [Urbifossiella sp.]|jgi:hypothetical protein